MKGCFYKKLSLISYQNDYTGTIVNERTLNLLKLNILIWKSVFTQNHPEHRINGCGHERRLRI